MPLPFSAPRRRGATLLELIVYIGGAAIVLIGTIALLTLLSQSWLRGRARAVVEESLRGTVERIRAEVQLAQGVIDPAAGASGDILKLDTTSTGASQTYSGYAWSENVGWISFSCANQIDPWDCTQSNSLFENYAVKRTREIFSGFAMTQHTGFISFNCADTPNMNPCGQGDYRVTVDASGDYHGWAWGESVGWISFNCADRSICGTSNYKVYEAATATGVEVHGWAWSENWGWISFNCAERSTLCDTIPYKVISGIAGTSVRFAVANDAVVVAPGAVAPQNLSDPDVRIEKCAGESNYFTVVANPAPARPTIRACFRGTYIGQGSSIAVYASEVRSTFQLQ